MTLPAVWPRPGVTGYVVRVALQDALNRAQHVPPTNVNHLSEYVRWVSDETSRLRHLLEADFVDRLIRTPAYWVALGMQPDSPQSVPFVNHEMGARQDMLLETIAALERLELRFASPHPTTYVVPDTDVLLEYPGQLPGVDWFQHLAKYLHLQDEVRVVVPLAVVDELDNLKRVPRSSKRAKTALKQLYSHFGTSVHARPTLHEGTAERGRVFVELLMEPPSHVRLPRMDDELVRVAERLSAFTQRKPVFVSYDTGAAFRVSAAELPHVRLTHRDDE